MKTNHLVSVVKTGILALSCTAFLASCTKETQEVVEPLYTMGDPKNSSPQGSRCFEISSFEVQGEEQTSSYQEIIWTFQNNGTVIASSPNQEWLGNWNIGEVNGVQKFFLNFPDAPPLLDSVAGIWIVESLDSTNPQFIRDEDGPNPDVLEFTQSQCASISPIIEVLNGFRSDTMFVISSFVYQGNDVTDVFSDVFLNFSDDNVLIAERYGQQVSGQWMASETQDGTVLAMQFTPPPAPLTGLSAVWDVVSFSDTEIVMEDVDGPPDTGSYLIITMEN